MAELLKLKVTGYRDVHGRMTRRTDELARARRNNMRELARGMVSTLRWYAPEDTGKLKEGIAYRTDDRGSTTSVTFYVRGEHAFLLELLVRGTRPHPIPKGGAAEQLAKGYPLHWIDKRTGEHHFAWSVWHPGTIPDPFVERAVDAMSPQYAHALGKTARQVIWL